MRPEARDWLFLIGKSILVILGGILGVAALVDLAVSGPNQRAFLVLAVGTLLGVPPLALAFRDAVREAKKGRL